MEFYVSFMDMIKKLAKARLDDVEHAVLTLILLVERGKHITMRTGGTRPLARKLASNPDKFPFASLVNDVFRELHKHYEDNYEDTALRMDQLVLLALEIQVSIRQKSRSSRLYLARKPPLRRARRRPPTLRQTVVPLKCGNTRDGGGVLRSPCAM